jgi:hypothetical protein
MRVVEKKMVAAVKARKNMRCGSTTVSNHENTTTVFLHRNPIAVVDWNDNTITVDNCGWETVTTKSRLNAVLREFTDAGIHQHQWVWYMGREEFARGTRVPMTSK